MKKVLLICSSRLLFSKIALQYKQSSVAAVTALVASPIPNQDILALGVAEIIRMPGAGGFRYRDLFSYYRMARAMSFDEVVCLYNNETGDGYLNIDLFAWCTPAAEKKAYTYSLREQKLTGAYVGRKLLRNVMGSFWFVVNTVLMGGVLVFIAGGMIGVEIFRGWGKLAAVFLPGKVYKTEGE